MSLNFFNVRHVSFDLWLTLIKSNPLFKQKRDELLKDFFQIPHSVEVISAKIRMWDLRFNAINEISGKNIDCDEMVLLIMADLDCDLKKINSEKLNEYYNTMEKLFFEFHPLLYEKNLLDYLKQLADKNITMSVLSNTGFIKGSTLKKLLDVLNISPYLKFQIYSDEIYCSKPSKKAYEHVMENIKIVNTINISSILHIGDNHNADYLGATNFGLQGALINSNNVSLLHLNIQNN
jgi:putative hydrolase of the HAD superfamily